MLTSNIYSPHFIFSTGYGQSRVFMAPFDSQRVSLFYTFKLTISVISLLPLSNNRSHGVALWLGLYLLFQQCVDLVSLITRTF